jgi:lincosamide nucleotidyltransferase A/C/D/E
MAASVHPASNIVTIVSVWSRVIITRQLALGAVLRPFRSLEHLQGQDVNSVDVVDFYRTITQSGVNVWIDGGWGVDALLGEQTRPHEDLDIAIQTKDVPVLRRLLQARGYADIKLEIARPWNFVLGDENGREIDVHVIVLDDQGDGIYGPPEKGEKYPAASLTGTGNIDGQAVRCISSEWMVKFHFGYDLKDKDFRDVSALCNKFGIELPTVYERFKERISGPSKTSREG